MTSTTQSLFDVGVVIPTHTRRDLLPRAISSCGDVSVVVVDDSPGGMNPLGGVQWLRSGGDQGFARAVNLGLSQLAADGKRVALVLNDDATLAPAALAALTAAWRTHPGVVGPVIQDLDGNVESTGFRLEHWGRLQAHTTLPTALKSVDAVSGACLMVGVHWRFDPAFTHGMEDIELCRRVRKAGGSVHVVPHAHCTHQGGATVSRATPAAQRHAVAGHLRLVGGGWRTLPVLALAMAQSLRERGGIERFSAVFEGYRDFRIGAD
ncbi:MAG TPA: hypothetical protein DFR83_24130 [Deltaproteobacteria bacterium]|nr:hypothetical protein [Deltaproteobacteria bacterium]